MFTVFIVPLADTCCLEPLLQSVERSPGVFLAVSGQHAASQLAANAAARCSRIKYLGAVAAEELPESATLADVVYFGFDPARPTEQVAASTRLFHALADGVPVVSAGFGEIEGIADETGCGLLLPDYTPPQLDAAIASLADPRRMAQFRAAARAASGRYTRRAAETALQIAYARLVARRELAALGKGPEAN